MALVHFAPECMRTLAALAGYNINGQQLFYPNANDPNA
jgi:hypothetical protein